MVVFTLGIVGDGAPKHHRPCRPVRSNLGLNPEACRSILVKTGAKVSTTIRFDPDLLAALKASGSGWQTRVNQVLREAVRRGQLAS